MSSPGNIDFANQIAASIERITSHKPVGLHEPILNGNEQAYLSSCLKSNYVSSVGPFVDQFERSLEITTGAKHAIAVVNGTAALHIALTVAGVRPGDEVLVPALTFVATANAVVYCGAIPHFVDSEEKTLGVDVNKLREYLEKSTNQVDGECINTSTGRRIRALVPMHCFGHPSDLSGLMTISKDFNLMLVEDAAESLGSLYKGQHTGTFGQLGIISFNGNKIVTTGGGGAILTNDPILASRAKHLSTTAKIRHTWIFEHDEIGFNYRMPNLNAALGCAQLEQLNIRIEQKRKLFKLYQEEFSQIPNVNLVQEPPGCRSNYWLQTIILGQDMIDSRDMLLEIMNAKGIMTRPAWKLIAELKPFKDFPTTDLTSSQKLSRQIVNLPSNLNRN